jgi:hypothetical protein
MLSGVALLRALVAARIRTRVIGMPHTHAYTHTHTHMHACTHARTHACTHAPRTHARKHSPWRARVVFAVHLRKFIDGNALHTHTHTHTNTNTHTIALTLYDEAVRVHACVHECVCPHTRMHTRMLGNSLPLLHWSVGVELKVRVEELLTNITHEHNSLT